MCPTHDLMPILPVIHLIVVTLEMVGPALRGEHLTSAVEAVRHQVYKVPGA